MPYTNSQGVRIHYELEGKGAPLVLQYGQYFPLDIWYELNYVAALKDDFQLILVDARGQGDSDKPYDPAAYRLDLMASDVVAVLDHLGIQKAHYMGYSSGSLIGFGILKFMPDRLRSLVAGGGHPYDDHVNRAAWCEDQIRSFERESTEHFVVRLEQFLSTIDLPPLSARMRTRLLTHDPRALIGWLRQYPAWPSFEDILNKISVPCLLYVGANDGLSPVQNAANEIPNATFVAIPNGGHLEGGTWVNILAPHIKALVTRAVSA
jgi:pimeloyl-ACP methyl ester carboxylesterase